MQAVQILETTPQPTIQISAFPCSKNSNRPEATSGSCTPVYANFQLSQNAIALWVCAIFLSFASIFCDWGNFCSNS